MKKLLSLILCAAMIASALTVFASAVSVSDVRTESGNEKLAAPAEDDTLELWFDHVSKKQEQSDLTSSGLYTYTMTMAKNEIEDCQFFLASSVAHDNITVEVSDFVGPDVLETELFWELYVKMGKYGNMPDPLIPFVQPISIKANASQGFFVKVKTAADTPAGDYKATVDVKNEAGEIIKTAGIKLRVRDFALAEKTPVKTLFGMGKGSLYSSYNMQSGDDGSLYAHYYDFLLENRICAYDLPYSVDDPRIDAYLDNERVNSFCIGGQGANVSDDEIRAYYSKLSQKDEWFSKGIFYYVDEPSNEGAIGKIAAAGEKLAALYPGYKQISPYFLNYEFGGKDMIELMSPYINVWCTKINAWTPQGASGSGVIHMLTDAQIEKNGAYAERMAKEVAGGDENWDYFCWEPIAPYVTFDAAHQGIEQRIAFWQTFDVDATGLLYFAVNENSSWRALEKINAGGVPVYGDGTMLYYGSLLNQVKQPRSPDPVSSTRIENIRDGIEDYMYLDMARTLYGEETVEQIIDSVTTSVIDWTKDGDVLQNARNILGDMIEEKLATPKSVPDRLTFVEGSQFRMDGDIKIVLGVNGGVTVGKLISNLEGGAGISVFSPDGDELESTDFVFDGCVVRLFHKGVTVDEATVRVVGDVDLDGRINARDVTLLMRSLVGWDEELLGADLNADGKVNVRDVIELMKLIIGDEADVYVPRGEERVWKGTTTLLLYTDVPDTDGSRVCRTVDAASLGANASVNFAVPYGQYVKGVTIPASIAEGGSLLVRLNKLDGEGKPKYEWNYTFTEAENGFVKLDMTDLIDGHSFLGAGLYSVEIVGSENATLTERNAVIRENGYFPGASSEDDGRQTNFEATVTVEYLEGFELSKDVNLSTMIRPVETTVEIPGLTREYTLLHVTDSHLTLSYDDELNTDEKRSEQRERNASFTAVTGVNSADRFPYYIRYAELIGADRIAATGDIVDYASQKNVDTAFRDNLAASVIPFTYCFGNHDWSYRWNYVSKSARLRYGDPRFSEYMGGDTYYEQIEYDDFILISVDNSSDHFWKFNDDKDALQRQQEYFEKFKAANEIGKPIVLMFHVPFWSPTLEQPTKDAWGGRNILIGPDTDIKTYNGVTKEMYDMISGGETNVALMLCGHVHFNHIDMVGSVPQIVTGDGYEGYTRVIRLVPAE